MRWFGLSGCSGRQSVASRTAGFPATPRTRLRDPANPRTAIPRTRPRSAVRGPRFAILWRFACRRTTLPRYPSQTTVPSSVSGRTSICRSSRRDEELARLESRAGRGAVRASAAAVLGVGRVSAVRGPRAARGRSSWRAASAEYLRDSRRSVAALPRPVLSARMRSSCATCSSWSGASTRPRCWSTIGRCRMRVSCGCR